MKQVKNAVFLVCLLVSMGGLAQESTEPAGITYRQVEIAPEVSVSESYDNRVLQDSAGHASSDFYTEVYGAAEIKNMPARYGLSAKGGYGQRLYSDYTDQNSDFYNAAVSLSSDQNALVWGLSAGVTRSLSYDTAYHPDTGTRPDTILSSGPSRRWTAGANVAYAIPISEKTALVPGYTLQYYRNELENSGSAEWQTHSASMVLQHALSDRTQLLAGSYYTRQVNDDEDGSVVLVGAGAKSRITDKTSWDVLGGIGYADYERSGTGKAGLVDLRVSWQATDRVSTYVFYGNDYQPGYGGGGARLVYRGGYGAGWAIASRWTLSGQVLHSYEDVVGGGNATYGGVQHFFSAQCDCRLTRKATISLSGRNNHDEFKESQTIVAIKLDYRY